MLNVIAVVAAYLVLAAVDLPGLYGRRERRGEFIAAAALLGVGMALSILFALGFRPPSIWKGIAAVVRPVGTLLFYPAGK